MYIQCISSQSLTQNRTHVFTQGMSSCENVKSAGTTPSFPVIPVYSGATLGQRKVPFMGRAIAYNDRLYIEKVSFLAGDKAYIQA